MLFKENPPVITGLGLVTPIGTHRATIEHNLERGKSGLGFIDRYDPKTLPVKKAFEVKGPLEYSPESYDPHIAYALHAARAAITDSACDLSTLNPEAVGVVVSSSKGGMISFEKLHNAPSDPELFRNLFPATAASYICREFGFSGPGYASVSACATGLHSIIAAARLVAEGGCSLALAGASDASITPLMLGGYNKLKVYSRDDMRPFDTGRSGFIIGEGAGVMTIEPEDRARARGARIYARIRGFTMAQDCGSIVHFDPEAHVLSEAITRLLRTTELAPYHIQHVNMHATATQAGDRYEAAECIRAFGKDINGIVFNALKSSLGHMLGASGAVETIITALGIYNSCVYPTINVRKQDAIAPFNINRNRLTKKTITRALKISMGFGGQVGVLLLEK